MAENPIKKEDIIDVEGLSGDIAELVDVLKLLDDVSNEYIKTITEEKAAIEKLSPARKEDQKALKEHYKTLTETVRSYNAFTREKEKLITQTNKAVKVIKDEVNSYNDISKKLRDLERQVKSKVNIDAQDLKQINEYRNRLKELDAQMGKHQRSVGSYKDSIIAAGKSLAGFLGITGLVTTAISKLKQTFEQTSAGMKFFTNIGLQFKQMWYEVVQGIVNPDFQGKTIAETTKDIKAIAKEMTDVKWGEIKDVTAISEMEKNIALYRYNSVDATKSQVEQLKWLNMALEEEQKLIDYRLADAREELGVMEKLFQKRQDDYDLALQIAQKKAEIDKIESERNLRLLSRESALREKSWNDYMAWIDKENERKDKEAENRKKQGFAEDKAFLDQIYKEEVDNEKKIQDAKEKEWQDGLTWWEERHRATRERDFAEAKERIEEEEEYKRQQYEETERERQALYEATYSTLATLQTIVSNSYEKAKQREIKAAGDNAQKKAEIEKKYNEKQKSWAITMAVINGALAIVNAWKDGSWIENVIETAAIAAITAGEISTISSQQFAEGGDIKGKSHRNGGVQVEAEGGEYIINKRATSKYHDLIEAINKDNPMQIAEELRNRQFHTVWGGVKADLSAIQKQDPYTKMIYDLMKNDVKVYTDSNGDTVLRWPDGSSRIVRKYQS